MTYDFFGDDPRFSYLDTMLRDAGHERCANPKLCILAPRIAPFMGVYRYGGIGYEYSHNFREKNSIFTAEGALSLAISNTSLALSDTSLLILGYGYLGKALVKAFAPHVHDMLVASACDAELNKCRELGIECVELNNLMITGPMLIINTIPACVLKRQMIKTSESLTLLELASTPCTDFTLDNLVKVSGAALPGRFCAKSSAALMYEDIINIIKETMYE